MIVMKLPSFVKTFVREYCAWSNQWLRIMVGCLLLGFIVARGRRTAANLASVVLEERRDPSRVSRFFKNHAEDVVQGYDRAVRRSVTRALRRSRKRRDRRWLLMIDTTFQRKHALRMENLIQYREKSLGVPSCNHGFVVGVLVAPDGTRIPLPLEDFLTRAFLKEINAERRAHGECTLPHRTQLDLAVDLVRHARTLLPKKTGLIVVADNFFEGTKLDRACCALPNVAYVTTLDSARIVADHSAESKDDAEHTVKQYEKALPDSAFRRAAIPDGAEPFGSMRRREEPKRKHGRPRTKVFHVARRTLTVNGLGGRTVLFSWKRRRMKYNTRRAKANLRVLVTNDASLSTEEIVDAYTMRWQIELFFRELKSELGLGHYQVLTLDAIRSHVHLVLLAFLFLEMYRLDHIADRGRASPVDLAGARTRQLALLFETEIRQEEVKRLSIMAFNPGILLAWAKSVILPRKVA